MSHLGGLLLSIVNKLQMTAYEHDEKSLFIQQNFSISLSLYYAHHSFLMKNDNLAFEKMVIYYLIRRFLKNLDALEGDLQNNLFEVYCSTNRYFSKFHMFFYASNASCKF